MESVLLSQPGPSYPNTSASPTPISSTNFSHNGGDTDGHCQRDHSHGEQSVSRYGRPRASLGQRIFGDRAVHQSSGVPGRTAIRQSMVDLGSAYSPRGPYSQIYLQSTPEESGVSNEVHSHTRSRQETQDVPPRGLSEHCNYRLRSCAYILKEKDARKRLITLATSAVFLILVLALYLVFAVSNSILGRELHILLVFMILILAIVFCHSLIRLAMVILRSPTNQIPRRAGPTGYAQPERPIQVVLAGDEVLTESNSNNREKVVAPPPAYGLWRSSVRINPDLLYWQRVERNARPLWNHINKAEPTSSNKIATPRPPSYTSDNGIDYVVEAQPRSFTRCHIAEEPEHR